MEKISLAKYLIIITLAYYLVKGLIYLLLWQTTYKIEERAREMKKQKQKKKQEEDEIWEENEDK